jgi:hypothetical protein
MSKSRVYRFKKFDITSYKCVISRGWATRDAIERIKAVIISDTEIEIDDSYLDGNGMTKIDFTPL